MLRKLMVVMAGLLFVFSTVSNAFLGDVLRRGVEKGIEKSIEKGVSEGMTKEESFQTEEEADKPSIPAINKGKEVPLNVLKRKVNLKEVIRKLKAKNIWKVKTQYTEYDTTMTIMGMSRKMKSRAWYKAPSKFRLEVYEPREMTMTTVTDGRKAVYIDRGGRAFEATPDQKRSMLFQYDFTKYLNEFNFELIAGTTNTLTIRAYPKAGSFLRESFNYMDFLITRQNLMPREVAVYYHEMQRGMKMTSKGSMVFAKDASGISYLKRMIIRSKMIRGSAQPIESEFDMVVVKIVINGEISDALFDVSGQKLAAGPSMPLGPAMAGLSKWTYSLGLGAARRRGGTLGWILGSELSYYFMNFNEFDLAFQTGVDFMLSTSQTISPGAPLSDYFIPLAVRVSKALDEKISWSYDAGLAFDYIVVPGLGQLKTGYYTSASLSYALSEAWAARVKLAYYSCVGNVQTVAGTTVHTSEQPLILYIGIGTI